VSAENVDVVRRLYAALAEASRSGELADFAAEAATELLDPEVEFLGTVGGLAEGEVSRGRDQFARAMFEDRQEWEHVRFEPTEFVDAGDRVVVLQREHRRGLHSGIELHDQTAAVAWLRDGRVWRIQGYMDPEAALAAVR
jgi:ketosteroid isomerase-like protein